jgi:parallel beta-helix repeat protein
VRLTAAGPITINAPIWASQTVSLTTTASGTIGQSGDDAAITALNLAVDAVGGVTLTDMGNAVSFFAAKTTDDGIVFREDSGYSIGLITTIDDRRDTPQTVTVTGIQAGTGTVRLVTVSGETPSSVAQSRPIVAAGLGLQGAGTDWNLSLATNDVGSLAADTGTITFRDDGGITVGSLPALTPLVPLDGLRSTGTTGTVISVASVGGITLAEDISTAGGDVRLDGNVTVSQPVLVDLRGDGTLGRLTVTGSLAGIGPLSLSSDLTVGGAVSLTDPIHWRVSSLADSGAGSLRWAIANANASNFRGKIVFEMFGPLLSPPVQGVIHLQSVLPTVATNLLFDGTVADIVLDGGRRVATGLDYGSAAAGSVLRRVTLRNFTGFGVQLVAAQNVLVDTITVQSLNTSTSMGLYAAGDLSGTKVVGSTFSGGLRGALLDGARNLAFGELGSGKGNTLSNNRAAPGQPKFAGTGIRSQGDCTGTVVEGNAFTSNNYGFAFIAARNLTLRNNTFTRNGTAGIFIEGDSSGSTQAGNTFGTGSQRNKVNVLRAKKSRFG